MFGEKYGPLTQTVALASILVTAFSALLLQAVGKISQWTFLVHDSPPFMVTAGVRALGIALIAFTFIVIDRSNYRWFAGGAVLLGVLMLALVARLDRLRKQYLCKVPDLNRDGSQARTWWGKEKFKMVVIGDSADMNSTAAAAYRQLTVSPCKFMSGYGGNGVNDPAAIWPMEILARNSRRMTTLLMGIFLSAVLALYIAASAIEVHLLAPDTAEALAK
ncbi:MAG: hypothetical protein M5U07_21170 [Xanthobacteraceae bacterium]|nr:hypothetical protein [Xanthobacteraceae bacterium]PWB59362.1 MAG: hypothetical protein C3F17_16910 [Bradyrhizobiaceae bacterium]